VRLAGSQNGLHLGLKFSKSRWFAPDPAEGAYNAPPDPLVVRGFLPSALNPPLALPNKNTRPVSPPDTKS